MSRTRNGSTTGAGTRFASNSRSSGSRARTAPGFGSAGRTKRTKPGRTSTRRPGRCSSRASRRAGRRLRTKRRRRAGSPCRERERGGAARRFGAAERSGVGRGGTQAVPSPDRGCRARRGRHRPGGRGGGASTLSRRPSRAADASRAARRLGVCSSRSHAVAAPAQQPEPGEHRHPGSGQVPGDALRGRRPELGVAGCAGAPGILRFRRLRPVQRWRRACFRACRGHRDHGRSRTPAGCDRRRRRPGGGRIGSPRRRSRRHGRRRIPSISADRPAPHSGRAEHRGPRSRSPGRTVRRRHADRDSELAGSPRRARHRVPECGRGRRADCAG